MGIRRGMELHSRPKWQNDQLCDLRIPGLDSPLLLPQALAQAF